MNIWEITQEALEILGIPIAANAMIPASWEALPDLFLVYQLISSPPIRHADDLEKLRSYRMQVKVYSREGLADLPDVPGAMVEAGFSRSNIIELPYNADTRHYGLAMDFVFLSASESESESY